MPSQLMVFFCSFSVNSAVEEEEEIQVDGDSEVVDVVNDDDVEEDDDEEDYYVRARCFKLLLLKDISKLKLSQSKSAQPSSQTS